MTGEDIFGMILITGISWGCAAVFFGLGLWANTSTRPVGFWTGREVKPGEISDIPGYNRENAQMWKGYCVPYVLAGLCSICRIWFVGADVLAVSLLVIASTLGIWWLVRRYRRIEKRYRRCFGPCGQK